jgi:hypothetical protein
MSRLSSIEKERPFFDSAGYSSTGMFTSPNAMKPFHSARAIGHLLGCFRFVVAIVADAIDQPDRDFAAVRTDEQRRFVASLAVPGLATWSMAFTKIERANHNRLIERRKAIKVSDSGQAGPHAALSARFDAVYRGLPNTCVQ